VNWNDRLKKVEANLKGSFYTTNLTDIFYLTGLKLSRGALLIQKGNSCLFVDTRYTEYATKNAAVQVEDLSFEKIQKQVSVKPLYIDPSDCSYKEGLELVEKLDAQAHTGLNPIHLVRAQKSEKEIRAIRKSCLLLKKAYDHIRKKVKLGVTEKQLALEFELFARKNGAEKLSFEPIIAFGANSAMPHHRSSVTKLKKNVVVLMDLGVVVNGYASDMTRSFFYGNVSEKIQTLYTAVKKAQREALTQLEIGVPVRAVDQVVRDVFSSYGLEQHYLHALGHGVGLDVHEYPIISALRSPKEAVLQENMVVAVEPGLYLPKAGGIRLEEMYLITKEGPKKLTV